MSIINENSPDSIHITAGPFTCLSIHIFSTYPHHNTSREGESITPSPLPLLVILRRRLQNIAVVPRIELVEQFVRMRFRCRWGSSVSSRTRKSRLASRVFGIGFVLVNGFDVLRIEEVAANGGLISHVVVDRMLTYAVYCRLGTPDTKGVCMLRIKDLMMAILSDLG
ncbi:hypothetical protein BO94DRAFT_59407 [Aspergillus sclerotioniger CBS 115572]|uniref:Uncharacterized protein n=1 Tax=Aspergillus sclerotioniger CBS 115572 TaxID=1450535 RepID=A0A317WQI6_9EURO|nr:hypothetical protein BO94DRAFT_59407 [Aspergillus sclerotioniger CBS 115572]PWY87951.1 hypothetical protein BO94DRAFT_59407 [Aspergillus sclerotioniger CBS 115572]